MRYPSKMQDNRAINVENSINSGQVFLWREIDGFWYGVDGQNVLKVTGFGRIVRSYQSSNNKKQDFFRRRDDIDKIVKSISKDSTTKKAVRRYIGLRILDQDPFQCLITFIISSNSNIQKIKSSLEKISKKFGAKVVFEGIEFVLFPTPQRLARATIDEIKDCGVGYRAGFVKEAANRVALKKIDFEYLRKTSYDKAKKEMCEITGVGDKVADCVLLFSLNKLEAFPLDRWMIRILEKYYSDKFQLETKTITGKQYEVLHKKIVDHFGPFAGYAQQFLFKMERENHQKRWL